MTTTPNPTAEQIASELDGLIDSLDEHVTHEDIARALGDLRDSVRAGLLVGDPTEEQIEQAAAAEAEDRWWNGDYKSRYLDQSPAKSWQNGFIDGAKWSAAGVAPQEPNAHVNPLATSGERVKNQADSFNVAPREPSCGNAQCVGECGEHGIDLAPQEPSECEHEAWEETGGSLRCSGCKEWLAPHEPNECSECRRAEGHKMDCAWRTAPSPDREKLIAEAEQLVLGGAAADSPVAQFGVTKDIAFVRGVRWALDQVNTPPVPDGAKLAEVIVRAESDWQKATGPETRLDRVARAVVEYLRGGR